MRKLNVTENLVAGMECEHNTLKPCQDGVDSVYESASAGLWNFVDYNPPIHWEQMDITVLQSFFNCTSNVCKQ